MLNSPVIYSLPERERERERERESSSSKHATNCVHF